MTKNQAIGTSLLLFIKSVVMFLLAFSAHCVFCADSGKSIHLEPSSIRAILWISGVEFCLGLMILVFLITTFLFKVVIGKEELL
jgi:hypothetical protein